MEETEATGTLAGHGDGPGYPSVSLANMERSAGLVSKRDVIIIDERHNSGGARMPGNGTRVSVRAQ